MNERGMVFPSVIGLLLIITGLLTGSSLSFRNQVQQSLLTQESYRIRSMVELAEKTLLETIETNDVDEMIVTFTEGHVEIERVEEMSYQLVGHLPNGRRHSMRLDLTATMQQENDKETADSEPSIEEQEGNEAVRLGGMEEEHE